MKKHKNLQAGQKQTNDPRLAEEIVRDFLANSNSPFAVAYRRLKAGQTVQNDDPQWHPDTLLGVDLKTLLRSDKRMKTGKVYQGVLRCDSEEITDEFLCRDAHYTFVESLPWHMKRNPIVFRGKYVSLSRRDDGSLRPNFKPMPKIGEGFTVDNYAFEVYRELRQALEGLVGRED